MFFVDFPRQPEYLMTEWMESKTIEFSCHINMTQSYGNHRGDRNSLTCMLSTSSGMVRKDQFYVILLTFILQTRM